MSEETSELRNAVDTFVDDMLGVHLEVIRIWSELKESIPEEDNPRYEDLIEQFGYRILALGKMPGDLLHYYNAVDSGFFEKEAYREGLQ
tara:strand:- start:94 stop:360 length:267 start_codon:yes stop_codon:yes gene_type:complete